MVDDERTGLDDVRLADRRAAQEGADARQQLEIDVPRHGVVGAALERSHTDDRLCAGLGENDHRDVPVPRASGLTRAKPAAELGLAGYHDVGKEPLGEIQRPRRPGRLEDDEPVLPKLPEEVFPGFLLVLCEEDGVGCHAATLEPRAAGRQMSIAAVV
jgi:hypothetical protein